MKTFEHFTQVMNSEGIDFVRRIDIVPLLEKMNENEKKEAEEILLKNFNGYDEILINGLAYLKTSKSLKVLENAFEEAKINIKSLGRFHLAKSLWQANKDEKYIEYLLLYNPTNIELSKIDRSIYVSLFSTLPRNSNILNHLLNFVINDPEEIVRFNALKSFFLITNILKTDSKIPDDLRVAYFSPIKNEDKDIRQNVVQKIRNKFL